MSDFTGARVDEADPSLLSDTNTSSALADVQRKRTGLADTTSPRSALSSGSRKTAGSSNSRTGITAGTARRVA